jgi:hypothetical protein
LLHGLNQEYNPPGHIYKDGDLQSGSFLCQLEELATGTTKHFSFSPKYLPSHQVWELIDIENTGMHSHKMFPARQQRTNLQANDTPLTTSSIKKFTTMDIKYKPSSLPMIALDSPHIASESGNMN